MNNVVYGQLQSEKIAEENEVCRKIVREIAQFGVTQRQQMYLIYLLALELENIENMRAITSFLKETVGSELFLSDPEHNNGKIDVC
jgi:hypothetical protein